MKPCVYTVIFNQLLFLNDNMPKSLTDLVYWAEKGIYFGTDPIKVNEKVCEEYYTWWKEFNAAECFYASDDRYSVNADGILSFKDVMRAMERYEPDEDLHVAYMLIPLSDGLESIDHWCFWPSEKRGTHEPFSFKEYEKPYRSRRITPFRVIDGKRYMVLISVTFSVKLDQLYAPMGISKSSWALMLDARINTEKREVLIANGEYKRVSGLSKRFHALIAAFVVKNYSDTIKIIITRPTYTMTEILLSVLEGKAVSIGSVKDRKYLESNRTMVMKSNSLKGLKRNLYETIESTGKAILDDSDEGTWKFVTSSNSAFKIKDWEMEIPNFWKIIEPLWGIPWLPVFIVDIHDLANTVSPILGVDGEFLLTLSKLKLRVMDMQCQMNARPPHKKSESSMYKHVQRRDKTIILYMLEKYNV